MSKSQNLRLPELVQEMKRKADEWDKLKMFGAARVVERWIAWLESGMVRTELDEKRKDPGYTVGYECGWQDYHEGNARDSSWPKVSPKIGVVGGPLPEGVMVGINGQLVWEESCPECGSPSYAEDELLYVSPCPECGLPGCENCIPHGDGTMCMECYCQTNTEGEDDE